MRRRVRSPKCRHGADGRSDEKTVEDQQSALGIILMVTGIIALVHALLSSSTHLGTRPTFIIGIVLVVLGLPFLIAALRSHSEAR